MKDLIEYIARLLVESPDQVRVEETRRDDTTVFQLRVAKEDLGKVIGKNGRTARSIRSLLGVLSAKEGRKAILEIVE
ncbi:MAG: KH domain-containing protein [Candidatus Eisenbacteria bacterium]|nr:KH domain-containing protein [Candidatus Eisenbacteria bacterium]